MKTKLVFVLFLIFVLQIGWSQEADPAADPVIIDDDSGGSPDDPVQQFFDSMKEIIGLEVGAVTIDGVTYTKAVIRPTIPIGKLTLGLYLPFIYQDDLFDVSTWYKSRGNNEWSFGTDVGTDPLAIVKDVFADLLLKIRFIGWGDKRDPFYFAVGNMNDITLGHGLIMNDYANDGDFPVIRRIGVDIGVNLEYFGVELIVNDLVVPEILGGRVHFRPGGSKFPLSIGLSGIADINPASGVETPIAEPIIISAGLDLDYPLIDSDAVGMLAYADVAIMVPYFADQTVVVTPAVTIEQGFRFETVFTADKKLKNFGAAAGLMGNLGQFEWQLEARFYNGTFRPGYFDQTYDRMRYSYVEDLVNYLANPSATEYSGFTLGIFGSAGYSLEDKFAIESGYMWPWDVVDGNVKVSEEDTFYFRVLLDRELIPYIDTEFSFEFNRRKLIAPFATDNAPVINNFKEFLSYMANENTVIQAQARKGLGDMLDIVFTYQISLERDAAGQLVFVNGVPQVVTTTTLETSFNN